MINLESLKNNFKLHVIKYVFQNIFYLNTSGRVILNILTYFKLYIF